MISIQSTVLQAKLVQKSKMKLKESTYYLIVRHQRGYHLVLLHLAYRQRANLVGISRAELVFIEHIGPLIISN